MDGVKEGRRERERKKKQTEKKEAKMKAVNISAHLAKFQRGREKIIEDVSPQIRRPRGEFAMSGGRREQLRNVSVHSTHPSPPSS